MERLTDDTNYCTSWSDCEMPDGKCRFLESCYDRKIYNRLRECEDLEEQGLLIRLPCKVGEWVYCIEEYEDKNDYSCYLFVAICNDFVILSPRYTSHDNFNEQLEEMCEDSQEWLNTTFVMFPRKKVFLTRKEAEAALAEMEG